MAETRRMIGLPLVEVEAFERSYGPNRLSWALSLLLTEFNKCSILKPDDYAAIASRTLTNKIEDL
jgi:hypothetical protein